MYDQVLDHFRNAAESTLQFLQELLRNWTRQWPQLFELFGVPTLRGQFRPCRGWYLERDQSAHPPVTPDEPGELPPSWESWSPRAPSPGEGRGDDPGHRTRRAVACAAVLAVVSMLGLLGPAAGAPADESDRLKPDEASFRFPTVPPEHEHVRALLDNALRYVDSAAGLFDKVSGYPVEGWNQDPERQFFLRSFTQLTAIGHSMELLACLAAGEAEVPFLSREEALTRLAKLVASLRQDQRDPKLSAGGLLVNFLDLNSGQRQSPLTGSADREPFLATFGPEKGQAIWAALAAEGWITPRGDGREADITRGERYGYDHFDGDLAPFRDETTRQRILTLLDRRVVLVVFGDNANLSASAAKTIGALLHPSVKDDPVAAKIRRELECFLDDQAPGYTRLYDAQVGQFYFGWDATRDRLFGWEGLQGQWVTGHMDYLVNEFRAPATFVTLRFGLPLATIEHLGFKMKSYRLRDGCELHALAPWEGSSFQALGLGLWLTEPDRPSWRRLLRNVVAIELDYAKRHGLPGFLSESYTGRGVQYTGDVGIPEIAVSLSPRITDIASLYTLGPAYTVAPEAIERFLAANWPVLQQLLTGHGPWEGYNVSTREVIRFQTTAHTLGLALGLLGTTSDHMERYLAAAGLAAALDRVFAPGPPADLLSGATQVFAWHAGQSNLRTTRAAESFRVQGDRVANLGVAFVWNRPEGVSLSGGLLRLRYRSAIPLGPAVLDLKPAGPTPEVTRIIPTQIFTYLAKTGDRQEELRFPLPATPGLARIKEVVLSLGPEPSGRPIDLTVTCLDSTPILPQTALEPSERVQSDSDGPPLAAPDHGWPWGLATTLFNLDSHSH